MLTKPTNWDTYLSDANHYYESVLVIDNTVYTQDKILSLESSLNLYGDEYSLGGVCMNEWKATLQDVYADSIPKFSRVQVWTRLCKDATHYTDYIPKGVFYTKKPDYDVESKILTISGYDEMFRAEQTPFEVGSTVTIFNNPTLRDVAKHIVQGTDSQTITSSWGGISLQLEDETQISNTLTMSAIPYGYTVREILRDIAIACGGNWTICNSGTYPTQTAKLRLIPINSLPTITRYIVTENDEPLQFGEDVILWR